MQHPTRTSITRRRLFGIGAATGAAVATGTTATAFAAAGPDSAGGAGLTDSDAARPNAVTPAAILPGASVLAIGYSSFQAAGTPAGAGQATPSSLVFASPASIGNTAPSSWVHAPISLPAGAKILRIDIVGYRTTAGTQTWNLYRTNLQGPAGLVSVGTVVTNNANGDVQATLAFATPVVVGIGDAFHIELANSTIDSRAAGAMVQYLPAPAGGLITVAPKRVYDSRKDAAGKIVKGATRVVNVSNEIVTVINVVPAGAKAIAYNLTITDTESDYGYLTIVPGGDPTGGVSSINWDKAKATLANGLIVGVNANREVSVFCDGTGTTKAHFVIDVVGYFL